MLHNPDAKRTPDGEYLIFYDGASRPTGSDPDIHKTQRVGLAVAQSPFGPWKRFETPILKPTGQNGTWVSGLPACTVARTDTISV